MNHSWLKAACGGLIVAASTPVLAGTIRHDQPDEHTPHLILGNAYKSAGSVYVGTDLGEILGERIVFSNSLASGVLIAPNWVLTAAHVIDALEDSSSGFTHVGFVPGKQDPDTASPFLDPPGAGFHNVGGTLSHPGWAAAKDEYRAANPSADEDEVTAYALTKGYDIGLMYLDDAVTDITPAARYGGAGEVGETATFVGYGMRGTGLTGTIMSDELRRAGHNVIDMVGGNDPDGDGPFDWASDRILLSDFDDPADGDAADAVNLMGGALPLDLEYSISQGDSGGPVFIDFPDDGLGPVLVGINSFNGAFGDGDPLPGDGVPNSEYDEFFGAVRVSAFNDWIDATMASYVPEPGALAVLAAGLGAMLMRRRRVR